MYFKEYKKYKNKYLDLKKKISLIGGSDSVMHDFRIKYNQSQGKEFTNLPELKIYLDIYEGLVTNKNKYKEKYPHSNILSPKEFFDNVDREKKNAYLGPTEPDEYRLSLNEICNMKSWKTEWEKAGLNKKTAPTAENLKTQYLPHLLKNFDTIYLFIPHEKYITENLELEMEIISNNIQLQKRIIIVVDMFSLLKSLIPNKYTDKHPYFKYTYLYKIMENYYKLKEIPTVRAMPIQAAKDKVPVVKATTITGDINRQPARDKVVRALPIQHNKLVVPIAKALTTLSVG